MQPQHSHEVIHNKSQGKLFVNDVCLRAASEIVGGDFLSYPLDTAQRSMEITVDEYDQDWTEVGFRAVKIFGDSRERPRSVVYNFWAHSTLPNPEPMIKAYEADMQAELAAVIIDNKLDTSPIGETILPVDESRNDEDDDDDEDDEAEFCVVEKLEFSIDSQARTPFKEHHFEFVESGTTMGIMNFAESIDRKWLGDSFDEQAQLERYAREYVAQFDQPDLRIMLGILGRIGLLAPTP